MGSNPISPAGMSIFYRSERIGKDGKPFSMLKFRTLKESDKNSYNHIDNYTKYGRFMRKYRIDEIPQLWHVLTRRMNLVGPRPMEAKTLNAYPGHVAKKLLSVRPGLFGLAGIYFLDEEHLLSLSEDPQKDYWEKILPMKIALDFFYIDNRGILFDLWIIYNCIKKGLWRK